MTATRHIHQHAMAVANANRALHEFGNSAVHVDKFWVRIVIALLVWSTKGWVCANNAESKNLFLSARSQSCICLCLLFLSVVHIATNSLVYFIMAHKRKRILDPVQMDQTALLGIIQREIQCPQCSQSAYGGILLLPCNKHYLCYMCLQRNLQDNYNNSPRILQTLMFKCVQCNDRKVYKHSSSKDFPWKFHSIAFNSFLQSILSMTQSDNTSRVSRALDVLCCCANRDCD